MNRRYRDQAYYMDRAEYQRSWRVTHARYHFDQVVRGIPLLFFMGALAWSTLSLSVGYHFHGFEVLTSAYAVECYLAMIVPLIVYAVVCKFTLPTM